MDLTSLLIDKDRLEASICRDSFFEFLKRFWSVVIAEEPIWNWHIEAICNELQAVAERVFAGIPKKYDVVINVPPGTTKSTIVSIMFPAWTWTRMPSSRTITASYAKDLATTHSRKSRMIVKSEKWLRLFPEVELDPVQDAKSYWVNTHGGERQAVGASGMITGNHAHFLIWDDPIDPEGARSDAERDTANHFITETLSSRKVDKEISVMIGVQQRLHQVDPSGLLLDEAKEEDGTPIRHLCFPGEIEHNSEVKPRKYAKFYVKGLLDTRRLSWKVLKREKARLGLYGYAGQIKQRPAPLGGGMFPVGKILLENPPPQRHFKRLVRYWDKAGTPQGGAFTAGVLLGLDSKGTFWILDMIKGQWGAGSREAIIKQTAQLDGKARNMSVGVEQEPGSGGLESAQATIRNLAGYRVRADRPTGDKVARADLFAVQVDGANVKMAPGPWNKSCLQELELFPNSKYKDQVDALSGAFGMISKPVKRAGGFLNKKKPKVRLA